MHPFMRKVWDSLRRGSAGKKRTSTRLGFEVLEDRSVPTAVAAGSISGLVFLNTPTNGLGGAAISLTGTPTDTTLPPVNLNAVTSISGAFTFTGLPAGSYHLSAGPFTGVMGTASLGSVSASAGISLAGPVAVTTGASAPQDFIVQGGYDPHFITMSMFLTTTTDTSFPFQGADGAGAPNNKPVVSVPIAAQTLSSTTTATTNIDLAGHFSDPAITESAVTMNITAGGVSQQINVNLLDTQAPQTVANFFDYVNAGSYNNSFFHRETTVAKDNIGVLQGGGAAIAGAGPTLITPVLHTIPDEIGAANAKGTLAMANTGTANTATDQFFFNAVDNPSLDPKFTVYGKVADAASQAVLDALSATPVSDLHSTTFATANPSLLVNEVPLNGGPAANFPTTAANYLVINNIATTKRDDFLTYSIVSNSNAGAVTAALVNEQLTLTRVAAGSADIVVQATDRFGASTTQTIHVSVS